ncbi:PREDICTED: inositol polyphosphate 5-phosphatase K-like isoform X2 [Poecilia mexicana]|uniref:inositol polyphosphate 5-phosphatase K-like isoform X2 n=1 Tax=Poecilia mexicana TaxID=48701 RepID=UPI00072EA638|nr:PREDICTED: inositol polyphosphate 5-phosphatase K-like isoform X2 [Poecilia mexicana]
MDLLPDSSRLRSDSTSSSASQGSRSKTILRQRLAELMTCIEDMSSDDEAGEEVSRTLDEAFQLCGRLLPTDAFRLHMVTWNVATAEPPEDVASLLQLNDQPAIDLYVIGLQEVNATPVRFISDLMEEDSWSHLFMDTLGPKGFVKVTSVRMQGLLLLVFAKMMHLPFIRNIQTTYTRTGIFGYWGNKGAVSVRFSFYGHMMCFLNCHLAAHMHNALQRVDEFEYILETQDFDIFDTPHVLDHKVVFWFGDLNFRIEDHGLHFVRSSINGGRLNLLWSKDQLIMMKKKEPFLQEFDEGPLNFKPTYKFDRKADSYDTSGKKRKPAWTDRILWRIKPKSLPSEEDDDDDEKASTSADDGQEEYPIMVTQNTYTSVMSYGVSDHKPVIGNFTLELRKYFDTQLVDLAPAGEWSADHDALLTYTILEDFMSSTWDWIGLYKVGFKSAYDYETFVWVRENELPEVNEVIEKSVAKDDLPLLSGEYVLGYYSTNLNSIVGLSDNFQILESKRAAMEDLVSKDINGIDK